MLVVGAGRHTLHGVAAIGGGLREAVVAAVGRGGHHHGDARQSVLGAFGVAERARDRAAHSKGLPRRRLVVAPTVTVTGVGVPPDIGWLS
jgi:hypothetical protein